VKSLLKSVAKKPGEERPDFVRMKMAMQRVAEEA
jgi:hypothetical protein